jgi:hypothetical protein
MKINWHENPLRSTVEIDDQVRNMILLGIQNDEYTDLLYDIQCGLKSDTLFNNADELLVLQEKSSRWEEICNITVDSDRVYSLIAGLSESHAGDCVCFSCSCIKCCAEEILGVNTIMGLGGHQANQIMGAFSGGDTPIDQAILKLATDREYTKTPLWDKWTQEEYDKLVVRWKSEQKSALEWLIKYKKEHGF